MRDFGERCWAPLGSRPHVFITPGPKLTGVCEAAIDPGEPLTDWYPDWRGVVQVVDRSVRHVTLAWLDTPTTATPAGSWEALAAALKSATADTPPVTLTSESLEATSHGIVLGIAATPQLDQLVDVVLQSMRTVYGADAPLVAERHPHIAVAYGCRNTETPPLSIVWPPVTEVSASILLVDNNAFAPGGLVWNVDTERTIRLQP